MRLPPIYLGYGPSGVGLTDQDINRWSGLTRIIRGVLYDHIALFLARGFHTFELSFEFCDAIVNDIHGVIISAEECRPELYWETYLAFDEGEYYHGNNRDTDPVESYTRPEIARILAKYGEFGP